MKCELCGNAEAVEDYLHCQRCMDIIADDADREMGIEWRD